MKLHIGNLPKTVTDTDLNQMIAAIAPPTSLEIIKDVAGVSKGFGFAEFATAEEARAVIAAMDGRDVNGQALKLGEARPRRTDTRAPQA